MATIDEVLMKLNDLDVLQDTIQLQIDENLRTIQIPQNGKVLGVVGDKDVNHVNFRMPRNYNGFDMSTFIIRVHYQLPNDQTGFYIVTDKAIQGNSLVFSWLVSSEICRIAGTVLFSVEMILHDDAGVVEHAFYTATATGYVLEDGPRGEEELPSQEQKNEYIKLVHAYLQNHPEYFGANEEELARLSQVIRNVGNMTELSTDNKSSLVNAINEVVNTVNTRDYYKKSETYSKQELDDVVLSSVQNVVTSIYKVKGSIAFAQLTLNNQREGYVYNITNDFVTDNTFVKGAGISCPKGTNVVVVNVNGTLKWDTMAGTYDYSDFVTDADIIGISAEEIDSICTEEIQNE